MSDKQLTVDPISNLVTCSVQLKWRAVEDALNQSGYTLGFFNPKRSNASLRELLTHNRPNLFYRQYGQPQDWCVQVRSRGKGHIYETKRVPRTAAGPDFKRILLGSGRRYAVLEAVTLRLHPLPERIDWHWSYWQSLAEAQTFIDHVELCDLVPSFAGVYEEEKQPRALRREEAVLVTLRFAGLSGLVASSVDRAGAVMRRGGGESLRIARRRVVPFFEKLMEAS